MSMILGLDFGTTKTAAVIFDSERGGLLASASQAHNGALPGKEGIFEQEVEKHWSAMVEVIGQLPEELRMQLQGIGLTGQMHSVMGWSWDGKLFPLVTWQDRRASLSGRLKQYIALSGASLHDGYGGTTLAELAADNKLSSCAGCAALPDWIGMKLTGNTRAKMDATFAASWGIFDWKSGEWNLPAVRALNIPESILPEIVEIGSVIGHVPGILARQLGIPENIPVTAALGDNQASILGTGKDYEQEIFMTLGTGAQLSLVLDEEKVRIDLPESIELRPFLPGKVLAVMAALCGGKAFAWLGETVNTFQKALQLPEVETKVLLDRIDAMAVEVLAGGREPSIKSFPNFLGERYNPDLRGRLEGITLTNFTLGEVGASLALGIVRNLKNGIPEQWLENRNRLLGSGNGIRRVNSIQMAIQREFGLSAELPDLQEEAACGAALLAEKNC